MAITVLKNNVPWGPFSRAQIQEGLVRGDFTLEYLAHGEGMREWRRLGDVLDEYDRTTGLPPVPGARDLPPVPSDARPVGVLPPPPASLPPALPSLPPQHPPAAHPPEIPMPVLTPASFMPRFFAFAIDCAVLFLPIVFLFAVSALIIAIQGVAEKTDAETMHQDWSLLWRDFWDLLLLVATVGAWLYGALLECSRWQATIGKQWFGMKVTDAGGRRISFFRATGRHLGKCLSGLPCFLGFTAALFSPRGLAWHDRLAKTRVVKSKPS